MPDVAVVVLREERQLDLLELPAVMSRSHATMVRTPSTTLVRSVTVNITSRLTRSPSSIACPFHVNLVPGHQGEPGIGHLGWVTEVRRVEVVGARDRRQAEAVAARSDRARVGVGRRRRRPRRKARPTRPARRDQRGRAIALRPSTFMPASAARDRRVRSNRRDFPNRRYREGTTNRLSKVVVIEPAQDDDAHRVLDLLPRDVARDHQRH